MDGYTQVRIGTMPYHTVRMYMTVQLKRHIERTLLYSKNTHVCKTS
jgi:hypothetical protein